MRKLEKIGCFILILTILCLGGCQTKDSDLKNSDLESGEVTFSPDTDQIQSKDNQKPTKSSQPPQMEDEKDFELTDSMKDTLNVMCYTIPEFKDDSEIDKDYIRLFLFQAYTGRFHSDDKIEKDGMFWIEEEHAAELIKLILGKDYDVSQLTLLRNYEYCYYEDGYILVSPSDYPDAEYVFLAIEEQGEGYAVDFDMILGGEEESIATHTIYIVPADNENGFIVTGVSHALKSAGEEDTKETISNYSLFTNASKEEVESFAKGVQNDIAAADWKSLSEKIHYPITVGGGITFQTEEEFVNYDLESLFSDEWKAAAEETDCTNLFANYQGAMFKDGIIWITEVLDDDYQSLGLRVLTINIPE